MMIVFDKSGFVNAFDTLKKYNADVVTGLKNMKK